MSRIRRSIVLAGGSGDARVDEILRDLLGLIEVALPGRVRAAYLHGSWQRGDALPDSDVDVALVLRDRVSEQDERRARLVRRHASSLCGRFLDVDFWSDDVLLRRGDAILKDASVFLYGEDLRPDIPDPDPEAHARRTRHAPLRFAMRLRSADGLEPPVTAPDPEAPFLGYEVVRWVPPDHPYRDSLRDLVALVGFVATARIAQASARIITDKTHVPRYYASDVRDDFGGLVEFTFEVCRGQWAFAIPTDESDRRTLRSMCERVLAFENAYFADYHDFLLSELQRAGPQPRLLRRIAAVVYASRPLADAIRPAIDSPREDVRDAARVALDRIESRLVGA